MKRICVRRLLNGDEIVKQLGFDIFVPEEHSVKEQAEAFFSADIMLTPHGANSTNCIYIRKGTVFAEVFSPNWLNCINRHACEHLGIHYLSELGENAANSKIKKCDQLRLYDQRNKNKRKLVERAEELLCPIK